MGYRQCPACGKIVKEADRECPECRRRFGPDEPMQIGRFDAAPTVYLRTFSWIAYCYAGFMVLATLGGAALVLLSDSSGQLEALRGTAAVTGLFVTFAAIGYYTQPKRRSKLAFLAGVALFGLAVLAGLYQLVVGSSGGIAATLLAVVTLYAAGRAWPAVDGEAAADSSGDPGRVADEPGDR